MNRKFFCVVCRFHSPVERRNKDNFNGNQCTLFVRSRLKMIRQTNEIEIFAVAVDLRCATSSLYTKLSLTRKRATAMIPRKVIG
jgi:hypothetical protein